MAELYDRLERGIVTSASLGMDRGLYGRESNPTLGDARALLLGKQKHTHEEDDDMRRGLGAMSLSMSVNEDVKKIFQEDLDRRIALQLGQVMQPARETRGKPHTQANSTPPSKPAT
jgi:hypothetical protein